LEEFAAQKAEIYVAARQGLKEAGVIEGQTREGGIFRAIDVNTSRPNVEAATAELHAAMERTYKPPIPVCNFGEFAQRKQRSEIFSTIQSDSGLPQGPAGPSVLG